MDFPKSVPSIGLVDGKFIDEDPLAGTPGSLIPSEWGNAVTLEILKVIEDGGLVPDEDDKTQLSAAIHNIVSGSVVPFATKAEAEDGTINDKSMSPLRVFQAIAKVVTQATEGAFGWLKIGTQGQVNAGADDAVAITPKKLAAAAQVQAHTAFTSAGTSTALTLTPSPAITAYATNQRFSVKFHASSGINPTLNVSGKGPKNIKQYDSTGAKVSAVFVADQISDVVNDGVDFVLLAPLVALGQASETVNGSLKIASLAIVNALANDLTAVTPLKLGSGFSTTKAVNGYIKLPEWLGSLIIQWGWANVGDDQILDVTLPIAFPNTFYSAIATAQSSTATSGTGTWSGTAFRKSNSVISVGANSSSGTGVTAAGVCWIAIGA